jgi:hypothetical protein
VEYRLKKENGALNNQFIFLRTDGDDRSLSNVHESAAAGLLGLPFAYKNGNNGRYSADEVMRRDTQQEII